MLLGWASIWQLAGIAFCLGVAETLLDNAAIALLPAVVARATLEQANGRLYTTQTIANGFVGPPLSGGLFALAAGLPLLLVAALVGLLGAHFGRASHACGRPPSSRPRSPRGYAGSRSNSSRRLTAKQRLAAPARAILIRSERRMQRRGPRRRYKQGERHADQ